MTVKQLVLPFRIDPTYNLKDFIVASCNEEAHRWIMSWPQWHHSCLSLYGEKGCGKTHLGRIWQSHSKAHLLEAQDFDAIELETFTNRSSVFIIEDAHLIRNEEELFHFYNKLTSRKGYLLLLSPIAPAYWEMSLPDLRSRLHTIPAIKIHSPDEQLLNQVTQKLFADLQLKVDDAVIEFLLKHIERSFESIRSWVYALNYFSLSYNRGVTIPLVRELLAQSQLAETG